jgi:hypothetical protein
MTDYYNYNWRCYGKNNPANPDLFRDALGPSYKNSEPYLAADVYEACFRIWKKVYSHNEWGSVFEDIQRQLSGNHAAGVRVRRFTKAIQKAAHRANRQSLANRANPILWEACSHKVNERIGRALKTETWRDHYGKGLFKEVKSCSYYNQDQEPVIKQLAKTAHNCAAALNSRYDYKARFYRRGAEAIITKLGDDLNEQLRQAMYDSWLVYQFPEKFNKAAAQRFRTAMLKIKKLAGELRSESHRVRKMKSKEFVAGEFPMGSLVADSYYDYETNMRVSDTGIVCAHHNATTHSKGECEVSVLFSAKGVMRCNPYTMTLLNKTSTEAINDSAERAEKKSA